MSISHATGLLSVSGRTATWARNLQLRVFLVRRDVVWWRAGLRCYVWWLVACVQRQSRCPTGSFTTYGQRFIVVAAHCGLKAWHEQLAPSRRASMGGASPVGEARTMARDVSGNAGKQETFSGPLNCGPYVSVVGDDHRATPWTATRSAPTDIPKKRRCVGVGNPRSRTVRTPDLPPQER